MHYSKTLGDIIRDGDSIDVPRHNVHPRLLRKNIRIALVGVGGTGSEILPLLARMSFILSHYEGDRSFEVDVFDPDTVSEFNIGRQLFPSSSIGHNKAVELVNLVNINFGTRWRAFPVKFSRSRDIYDIVISCVDTAAARREIHEVLFDVDWTQTPYWIDCGNLAYVGHVVIGQPRVTCKERGWPIGKPISFAGSSWLGEGYRHSQDVRRLNQSYLLRLPCVTEIMPELLDPNFEEDDTPSCSVAEANDRQSPPVNRFASTLVYAILWELFRYGGLNYNGVYFDIKTLRTTPIPLRVWPIRAIRFDAFGKPVLPKCVRG